jgi:hypothetical protein
MFLTTEAVIYEVPGAKEAPMGGGMWGMGWMGGMGMM